MFRIWSIQVNVSRTPEKNAYSTMAWWFNLPDGVIFVLLYSFFFFLILQLLYLFIYLFLAVLGPRFVQGLSLVTASGGHSSSRCGDRSSSRCAGPSPLRPPPPRGTGSRRAGSAIVAHGPSRSAARGTLPDQGSNPCPLHQQADSQPLRHQGSPVLLYS